MGTIIKMILFAFLGYLLVSIVLSFKQVKKMQDQSMEEYQAKQEKFKTITAELYAGAIKRKGCYESSND